MDFEMVGALQSSTGILWGRALVRQGRGDSILGARPCIPTPLRLDKTISWSWATEFRALGRRGFT
jgi:hypothetical protein